MKENGPGVEHFRNIILLAISKAKDKLIEKGYPENILDLPEDVLYGLSENDGDDTNIGSCLGTIMIGRDILKDYDSNMYAQHLISTMIVFVTVSQNTDPTVINNDIISKYLSEVAKAKINTRWSALNTKHLEAINIVDLELTADTHPEWKHSDYANWILNNIKYRELTKDRLRSDLSDLFKKRKLDHLIGRSKYVKLKTHTRQ